MDLAIVADDQSLKMEPYEPVAAWLSAAPPREYRWHTVSFAFDETPFRLRAGSVEIIDYLRRHVAAYCPATTLVAAGTAAIEIEVHSVSGTDEIPIALPFGPGALTRTIEMPPDIVVESEDFFHAKWHGVECVWRPFDLLASLTPSTPPRVRLLVAGPAHEDGHSRQLRVKLDESPAQGGPRPKADQPFRQNICLAEIADLVTVMTVRARGHFCLHAATVASNGRGALLMGPSGSGKTTTALALLRGGFAMLADEHSVLRADSESVRITGFKSTPRIAGGPRTLADLERTLQAGDSGKADYALDELKRPERTEWLKPAAIFFLRIRPGARDHRLIPLPPAEAFVRATGQVLDPTNVFRRQEQASAIIRLVEDCPAYDLVLGGHLSTLPAVVRDVLGGAR